MVELEKREGTCPHARFYSYKTIGSHKILREAVKCLMDGTIHDPNRVKLYCAKRFELCTIYREHAQAEEARS